MQESSSNAMSERCKHGIITQSCAICAPRPTVRAERSTPSRRKSSPSGIDHRFENGGRTLIVTADLTKGWRRERRSNPEPLKTYCFSEVTDADWQGGRIGIQVSVFPRPGGLTNEWAAPPLVNLASRRDRHMPLKYNKETDTLQEQETIEDCCGIQATAGILTIALDLLGTDGSKPKLLNLRANRGGDAMFEKIRQCPGVWSKPYFDLDIQFRVTFQPPRAPAPVERSFWNDFLPGGRPESDRRKF